MSYSKKYLLKRVKLVNEIYLKYNKEGVTNVFIYENYIRDQFGISFSTFYNYLNIPFKKLTQEIAENELNKRQLDLFKDN